MSRSGQSAFSLTEVCLALGVAAFCLLAILGLLPVGLNTSHAAIEQTNANSILTTIAADLRATRPPTMAENTAKTPVVSGEFRISIPVNPVSSSPAATLIYFDSEGKQVIGSSPEARYRLAITFPPNGSSPATFVNLEASWPASVPPENAAGSVRTFLAIDRNL